MLETTCSCTKRECVHVVYYMTGFNSYELLPYSCLAGAEPLSVRSPLSLLRSAFVVRNFVKTLPNPVCVQGWMYHGNLLALMVKVIFPRVPVLFSIHNGSDHWDFTSVSGFVASRICGFFSSLARSTIFVSRISLKNHVPYRNSVVIPNPLKPLKTLDNKINSLGRVVDHSVTLACVARFDPIKNLGFMLDVIQSLDARDIPVRLLMAGEGMSGKNGELKSMLQARGLEADVELLGVVPDISSVYLRADYTILTSKCESFSNVLLESIACGTPFISSNVGIAADLVSPESTVIHGYDRADWVERVQKILQIRKTPMMSQSVKQHYEKISETYAPGGIAQLYADCWAEAIGR